MGRVFSQSETTARNQPQWHLELGLPTPEPWKTDFCCGSRSICGALLRQPQQADTLPQGQATTGYLKKGGEKACPVKGTGREPGTFE